MNSLFKFSLFFILSLLTPLVLTTLAYAEAASGELKTKAKQYYIVEVVLFRHLNEQGKNKEYWDSNKINPDMASDAISSNEYGSSISQQDSPPGNSETTALARYNLSNKRFTSLGNISSLSAQQYKLSDSAAHIKHSRDFRLLAHFGWTQRSLSKKRALPILLSADENTAKLLPEGELTLYVSRFLHMKVNLSASDCSYSAKAATINPVSDNPVAEKTFDNETAQSENEENINNCTRKTYLFKQNRKMRSKELHYIDNPIFGLLVYVTPFKA